MHTEGNAVRLFQFLQCLLRVRKRPKLRRQSAALWRKAEPLEVRELFSATAAGALASAHGAPVIPDPIAPIAAAVQQSSIQNYFTHLYVDQGDCRGYNGMQPQPDLLKARVAIFNALNAALTPAGGHVSYQNFNAGGFPGQNIVGVLPGVGPHANQIYLIGAHYDSGDQATGADDAASGTAGVLEAARVLAQHHFDRTFVFALFDQEEVRANGWGQGGAYFAQDALSHHENISGALILDQIAFNPHSVNIATLGPPDTTRGSRSAVFTQSVAVAYQKYTSLRVVYSGGQNETDAYPLFLAGFPSATAIEPENRLGVPLNPFFETFNDYYRDTAGNLHMYRGSVYVDLGYTTQMTKGAVAWAVGAGSLISQSAHASFNGQSIGAGLISFAVPQGGSAGNSSAAADLMAGNADERRGGFVVAALQTDSLGTPATQTVDEFDASESLPFRTGIRHGLRPAR
jgi:hypothetical protein